ncbi:hypothetical protein ACFYNX_29970 [Streptomyces sp. NPDC007872]|uniref:hypothetical protein n=1 Tax=Streptomyces sp. NPDC007872 TaxID=3364782 RepID=UPI00367D0F57
MTTEFAELHEALVEWLYDHTATNALGYVSITEFGERHGLDEQQSFRLLQSGKDLGLLDDRYATYGDPAANLTAAGLRWTEERKRRRSDPAARAGAARRGLLVWLWHRKHEGVEMPTVADVLHAPQSIYEGERLSAREIDRAAGHLQSRGLISGQMMASGDGPVHAEITTDGEDCVENYAGDIGAYERGTRTGGTTFHIGSNTGNIAANSRDFTLNATTNNGVDLAAVVMLARALRQAAPALDLPRPEEAELTDLANRIEEEAGGDHPDPSRLQRWGSSVVAILNSPVVSGALGSVLAAYTGVVLPGLPAAN